MKRHTSSLSPKVAGLALALFGFSAILGLGSMGEAQASQQALSQSFAPADRIGTGDYAAVRVNRGPKERKCPRSSNNGCQKDFAPKQPRPQTNQSAAATDEPIGRKRK